MIKDIVWASNAMINPAMLRAITHSFDDGSEEGRNLYTRGYRGNNVGESLAAEYFAPEIYVEKDANTNYEKLPHLFFAGSYWVVSGAVADVMRRFDMGGGHLYPTKVFRKDRKTPIGDRWFCLNFGNVKKAFLGSQSKDVYPFGTGTSDEWGPPTILKDGQLAIAVDASTGPDIWVDPSIHRIWFLSDPLAKALKEAGVAGPFGLKKCTVV